MKYPDEVWFGGIKVKKRTILTLFLTIIMLMGIFTINVGAYRITQRGTFVNGQQELIWGYEVLLEQSDGTAAGTKLYFEDQYKNANDYGTRVNNYFATFTSKPGENGTGSAHVMNGDDDIGINYTGSSSSAYSIVNFPPFSDYENEIGSNAIRPKSGFDYSHYTIEGLNGWENVKFYPGDALPLDCLAKGYIYQGIEYAGGSIPQYMYSINLTVVVHFKATTSGSAPEIPTEGELSGLLGNAVTVDCVNTLAGHADTTYGLIAGSYTIGSLATDNTGALPTYTVGVTVAADKYIEQYSTDKDEKHILNPGSDAEKVITLSWNEDAWEVSTTLPVTFEAMCTPKPEVPTEEDIAGLLENVVTVDCVNTLAGHADTTYGLIAGSYTIGSLATDNTGALPTYTVGVTVAADKYIEQYSTDKNEKHILNPGSDAEKVITLSWNEDAWEVSTTLPVTFEAMCAPKPEVPTEEDIAGLLENVVTVDCVNTLAGHADTTYGLIAGSYTIGSLATDNTGALPTYTVGVTVTADKYIEQYSTDKDEKHILNPGSDAEKAITLSWNEDAWEVSTTLPVTFEAMCAPKPEAPTEAELPEIFGEGAVEITCVTVESIHEQRTIAYDVIFGSVGEVVTHENPDGLSSYTLDIAIEADKYISKFSEDTKVAHIQIANENRLVKTNLTWDPYEAKWNPTENTELPVIFHIICTSETGGDDFIGKVYIQRLMLTKPSSGSPVPINEASSVTYRVVGLPTDPAKRENITIDVTVNDIKVDEKYIFCSSSNNGTEEYYFMMDSDLLNEAIGDQTFPAIITVRVQVTYTTELNKTLELAAEDFSYMVKAYRTGFGFGRLRP